MKRLLHCLIPLLITLLAHSALADSRVFTLSSPEPERVAQALRDTYGDRVRIELVRGRLLAVGPRRQLDEIGAALV